MSPLAAIGLAPGSVAVVRVERDRTANVLRLVALGLDLSGPTWADGPLGATLAPDESDIRHYALGKPPAPHETWSTIQSGLWWIRKAVAEKMPMYRVAVVENRIVVRAVPS